MAAFARAASAGGILLLLVAGVFAASPALAQSLSIGIESDGTGDATAFEGAALTFTVKMSATKTSDVTVKWRYVAGTAGSADYTNDGSQNLTISRGTTGTTFFLEIVDDARHENAETFEVEIYDASGATISRSKAQVTIGIDPDEPDTPQFRVDPTSVTVDEEAGSATVTVRHVAYPSDAGDITIPYSAVGITATATSDFDASGGTLTIPRGRLQTRTVRIPIVDDAVSEGDETFEMRFGAPSAGVFTGGANKATVTIRAHDEKAQAASASISSSPASRATYGAGETITVRLAMNEDVLVTGRPHVLLNVGAARRQAVYIGPIGSATDVLEFSYAVQAGDFDADGVALCARGRGCGSIQLDGGSIRAAADELAAMLRHPALAAQRGAQGGCGGATARGVADRADRLHGHDQGASRLAVAACFHHRWREIPADVQEFEHARRYLFEHRRLQQLRAGPGGGGAHGDPALQRGLPSVGKHSLNRREGQHLHHRHECPHLLVERGQSCRRLPRLLRRGVG